MSNAALEDVLASAGPAISARVIEQMYEHPFWIERFGGRGQRHAGRDGDFHIQYLCEAVASGDDGVFVRYARWLREVLVTRGMCSRHLADNFRLLAEAIDREPWPGRERAVAILRAGAAALAYDHGVPGVVDRARPALVALATASMPTADVHDLDHFLSYLSDAVALDRPELFEKHVAFMVGFYIRRGRPATHVAESLSALAHAFVTAGHVDDAASRYLAHARQRLEGR